MRRVVDVHVVAAGVLANVLDQRCRDAAEARLAGPVGSQGIEHRWGVQVDRDAAGDAGRALVDVRQGRRRGAEVRERQRHADAVLALVQPHARGAGRPAGGRHLVRALQRRVQRPAGERLLRAVRGPDAGVEGLLTGAGGVRRVLLAAGRAGALRVRGGAGRVPGVGGVRDRGGGGPDAVGPVAPERRRGRVARPRGTALRADLRLRGGLRRRRREHRAARRRQRQDRLAPHHNPLGRSLRSYADAGGAGRLTRMLTGGPSYWFHAIGGLPRPRPALPGSTDVDVAIVGGGFTGLWTAYYLKRADPALRICILESEVCGFGASGRNGGWVCGAVAGFGDTRSQAAIDHAVDEIGRVAAAEQIACDYHKGGAVHVVTAAAQLPLMRDRPGWLEPAELDQRIRVAGALGGVFEPN